MITFQIINDRFWLHDLEVMYSAAEALLNQEQIYGTSFGLSTGFYKYSPFTLFLFVPYALIPYKIACIIHFMITLFCAILLVPLLEQITRSYLFRYPKKYYLTLFVVISTAIIHLVRDLHLGNVNMILVFCLTLAVKCLLEKKHLKFGVIMAIVIMTKPFFIVFVLPLLLHRKFKEIFSIAAFGALFVVLSLFIIGLPESFDLYLSWFSAMLDHSSYLHSNNTIFQLVYRYFGITIDSKYAFALLGVIVLCTSLLFGFINRSKNGIKKSEAAQNKALIIHLYVLIAVIPSVFITDTEHFLFSLPLISIIVQYFSIPKRFIWAPIFAFIFFLYGGNSTDMMGDSLNEDYKNLGLLGISNLIIIGTVLTLYIMNHKKWERTDLSDQQEVITN